MNKTVNFVKFLSSWVLTYVISGLVGYVGVGKTEIQKMKTFELKYQQPIYFKVRG